MYAELVGFVLLFIAFGFVLTRFLLAQPELPDLGPIGGYYPDTPAERTVIRQDNESLSLWVVYTQHQWFVLDARVPFGDSCFCQWQPVTGLFEDPCSAAKFSMTGVFVDPFHGWAGKTVRDLDRYLPVLRDNHLIIDPNRVIHAEPFIAPGMPSMPNIVSPKNLTRELALGIIVQQH